MNLFKKLPLAIIVSLLLTGIAAAFNSSPSSDNAVKASTYTSECSCFDFNAELKHESAYKYGHCTGVTKAGTRCKRGVSNAGETRCYQHK